MFLAVLINVKRDDHVLAVTNPPSSPFAIALACRLKRARFILRIEDVYPEALFATGLMRPGSFLARVAGWFTRRLYRAAEQVIVLGRDMEQLVRKRIEDNSSHIVRIPNWAELRMIVPECRSGNTLLQELGLTTRFVVQYSGTMGRTHGLEVILQAAEALSSRTDIHFLFIGSGAKKDLVDQAASRLANVTVLPIRAHNELAVSLNACDVAIVSFIPGMAGISVPSRMYNIFAAGKPVIAVADSNSELALVIREEDIGWVVPPLEPDGIGNAILDAMEHPGRLTEMGLRARCLAEKYSRERIIECYTTMIQNLEPAPRAAFGSRTPIV
jgi:glycosyltransferase involved in cell wall biosynthesis